MEENSQFICEAQIFRYIIYKDDEIAGTKSSTSQSQQTFGQIKNLKGNENKFVQKSSLCSQLN